MEGAREQGQEVGGMSRRTLFFAARVAGWLIVPLYVAAICTSYLLERSAGLPNEHPLENAVLIVGFGAFAVVGAVLVAKRPTNAIGWIMAAVALIVSIFHAGDTYTAYVMVTRGHPDALAVVGAWIGSWYWIPFLALALIYLPLLFPDGRLLSRRWLPVAVLPGIGALSIVVLGALAETLPVNEAPGYEIDNPIGIEGLGRVEDLPIFGVLDGLLFVGIVGAAASVVVRFRRSRGVERQQMKWFVYAAALLLLSPVEGLLPEIVSGVWFGVVLIGLPTAIGIAVLRYRLYDIDLVINRTLVYGPLTVMLILVYLVGVVSLQYAFRALTGQESQIAIVASTLAIAALFNPLRRRVQAFVDRRFYRRKYDAAKTLESFSAKLRDETDLDRLGGELISVVRETMQPAHASLWLRPDTTKRGKAGNSRGLKTT
jgi:cell division protein FtsL